MLQPLKFVRFELSDPYVAPTIERLDSLEKSDVFCKIFTTRDQDGRIAWAVTIMLGFNTTPNKLNSIARVHEGSVLYKTKYLFHVLKDTYRRPQMQQATPHLLEWAVNFERKCK